MEEKKCTCGCCEGKECTCEEECNCDETCTCGCQEKNKKTSKWFFILGKTNLGWISFFIFHFNII